MSADTPKHVLRLMSEEYQSHLTQVKKLEHTIEQHQKMISHKTIPKVYRPQVLNTINHDKSIADDFNKEYEKIFFHHLERVITSNSITLEIQKAHLTSVLSQVDNYLSKLETTPDHIAQLYDNFITENQIVRDIPEKLIKILPRNYTSPLTTADCPPPTPQQTQSIKHKRKRTSKHPAATKLAKQNHFLSQGPPNHQQPP
jgi:hypothetical protein